MRIVDLFEFHSWHPHGHVSIKWYYRLVVGGWWLAVVEVVVVSCNGPRECNSPFRSESTDGRSFFPTLFLKFPPDAVCAKVRKCDCPRKGLRKPTTGRDRGQFVSAVSRCSCSRSFVSLASANSHGRWIRTMAWRRKRVLLAGGEEKRTRRIRSRRRRREE
ncbi:uncharacterized protein CCOS01_00970 [Colletotrichum costaricense]|uniref:Uncharacterized protein n=1 Tax=Colletotrichum costaricense TaxID=1209916 RepID=A0AAJ0E7N4_9PEZI|nr:uncharacterized protein CCOS01_00970 [Colletotrichum costaricense]KAK1539656.1 hypothetical protein CCOS01_00970 [Colletotrichum costaricense]